MDLFALKTILIELQNTGYKGICVEENSLGNLQVYIHYKDEKYDFIEVINLRQPREKITREKFINSVKIAISEFKMDTEALQENKYRNVIIRKLKITDFINTQLNRFHKAMCKEYDEQEFKRKYGIVDIDILLSNNMQITEILNNYLSKYKINTNKLTMFEKLIKVN